jgi:quinohemoprotein ethanol dehydrogenase
MRKLLQISPAYLRRKRLRPTFVKPIQESPAFGAIAAVFAILASPLSHSGGDVTDKRLLEESATGGNWLRKSGNSQGQYFSALTEITDDNVDELGVAWMTRLPVSDGIAGTPIVVDGVIYVGAALSIVFAIDATDGDVLWSYDPEVRKSFATRPRLSWAARGNRGIAVGDGSVYVATADCRLIAIDAKKGQALWEKVTCDPDLGYAITDSPYYGGGKIFVGNAGSESRKKNRGYVSAYDAKTGELLWRFYTVPSADRSENTTPAMDMAAKTWSGDALEKFGGGGSNWNEMTYDPESRLLFFGTAGSLPYIHSLRSPDGGDALFTSSILAVNADTGDYVWHYQTVPEDSWEFNATMNIVLADLEIDNKQRKTLLIAPKNGFEYVLDRNTGELLAAGKYARVTWASHVNLESGRPVMNEEAKYWTREAGTKVLVWPNMWGAHSWNPMAFSPQTGLLYIPVIDIPTEVTYLGDGDFEDTLKLITEIDGNKFSPGKLVAYDPVAQVPRWTVGHELPFNGGVLATAGNLVFQGDAYGHFAAYRATSGEKLWSMSTGSTISAAPASYMLRGTQYILLPAGAGGGLQYSYPELHAVDQEQGPTRLIAFRLRGDQDVVMPEFRPRELPDQPQLEATSEAIAAGEELFSTSCASCHGQHAVARYGGSVPDLRYANKETHATWQAIVVGGSRQGNGMPAQNISIDQSEMIRGYVLSLSNELRDEAKH